MQVETKDALLHAINEEYVEAVEVLLEHEESIHKDGDLWVRDFPTRLRLKGCRNICISSRIYQTNPPPPLCSGVKTLFSWS